MVTAPLDAASKRRKDTVRIGCAAAFWGDSNFAARQLLDGGDLDFLVFDYLAEITMSILAGQRMKDPALGYATDFVRHVMRPLLPDLKAKGVRVLANAGGMNPLACRDALVSLIAEAKLDLRVAVVLGDDLLPRRKELSSSGVREMDSGAALPRNCVSINAYLGAEGMVAALDAGADIVLTGRVVDSALVLAPLLHVFGWQRTDYDRLAQGSLAGHIIECGAQCTGGNFTDWAEVPGLDDMGFPIVEVSGNGRFVVSKVADTGGMVTVATVAEQLVYEIGDPADYRLPDVICDFTQVQLQQVGPDRVAVEGARGRPAPDTCKVSATWPDGFKCSASFLLAGFDAAAKAQAVSDAILQRCRRLFRQQGLADFSETSVELLGTEETYGPWGEHAATREVVVKIACAHTEKEALNLFAREIAPAATAMTPGLTGIVGGRPAVWPKIRLFSFLWPQQSLHISVDIDGREIEVSPTGRNLCAADQGNPAGSPAASAEGIDGAAEAAYPTASSSTVQSEKSAADALVPLIRLAWGRSGDKGNHANIGIIARKPAYLNWIRGALTEAAVARYMAHTMGEQATVQRFELPGIHALNFLLYDSLGGGGVASLRIDPQGKAFAQQLLDFPVPVPEYIARETGFLSADGELDDVDSDAWHA